MLVLENLSVGVVKECSACYKEGQKCIIME